MKPKGERQRAATVHDVARHAGVSSMTVSRVINGASVSAVMRERVMASVKALNYSPNLAARAARTGSFRIGLLYSNPSSAYLSEFMVGALEQSAESGGQLILERCSSLASQRTAMQRLIAVGVDGVLVPPPLCDSRSTLKALDDLNMPVIAVATGRPTDGVGAVRIDDYQGAWVMTDYLLRLGHRDIGFIQGDPRHTPAQTRLQAFLDRMEKEGISVPPKRIAEGLFTYRSGLDAAQALLAHAGDRPSAIFACNDDMAAAVVAMAHVFKLGVPEDLAIVGFDDTPVATTVWPQLTTIHQPIATMARQAVKLLVEEIKLKRAGEPKAAIHERLRFTLVKRGSTEADRR